MTCVEPCWAQVMWLLPTAMKWPSWCFHETLDVTGIWCWRGSWFSKLPFALRRSVSVLMYYFRDEVVKLIEVLFLSLPQWFTLGWFVDASPLHLHGIRIMILFPVPFAYLSSRFEISSVPPRAHNTSYVWLNEFQCTLLWAYLCLARGLFVDCPPQHSIADMRYTISRWWYPSYFCLSHLKTSLIKPSV